jgi:alkylation response protein AidB-like acyl-CoA dehydrogenase
VLKCAAAPYVSVRSWEARVNLDLPEDSQPIREMFERFFAAESTSARVRAAEPVGFDPALWRELVGLEAPFMRLSAEAGGGGMGLFDACLVMEQAGRRLASAPLAESMVALRVLGELGGEAAAEWIARASDGETVLTLALHEARPGEPQLVPGAAVAKGILTFDGRAVAIEVPAAPLEAPHTLGGSAVGAFTPGKGERIVIASNADAAKIWAAGIEEWKLLTSAALIGLSREALSLAAAYACERIAFGQPIGANQGIAHPLANDVIDADGAALFLWWTLRALADGQADAGAAVSMLFWFASQTATRSVAHALHTFGGYGLTNEYDIQLYHRRAKAWPLALGDPQAELVKAGRRLFLGEAAALPDVGAVAVDFEAPGGGEALAAETRAVFERVLTPEIRALDDHSYEGHDWGVHRALGEAGLLHPDWPRRFGGRDADPDSARASARVWDEVGYTSVVNGTTGMVGRIVMQFAPEDVQAEVLPGIGRGEITCSLGYTEPSGGSDVFAARTRAVRDPDGDGWIINGQKMFTSGAEYSSYVLMITRTDPDAPKHKGVTLFLVPLKQPGVEIRPVHTFMDERTNATFYDNVKVPDRYRLGEVNGGVKVLAAALSMEQGGANYHRYLDRMVSTVADWARASERDGRPVIEDPQALARLARTAADARIAAALGARATWTGLNRLPDAAFGPASKVFSTEAFIADSADLLDLAAPQSLLRGHEGLGLVEMGYRHSTATTIYAGTSEVLRSMVAERRLGLPRSRA